MINNGSESMAKKGSTTLTSSTFNDIIGDVAVGSHDFENGPK